MAALRILRPAASLTFAAQMRPGNRTIINTFVIAVAFWDEMQGIWWPLTVQKSPDWSFTTGRGTGRRGMSNSAEFAPAEKSTSSKSAAFLRLMGW